MSLLVEQADESGAKDGGFVFQATVSHEVNWEIVNGESRIDPKRINSRLHRVDVFPDMKFTEGWATSTYVVLSEVDLLTRKFKLASEAVKKRISPEYRKQLEGLGKNASSSKLAELTALHFNNTYFEVSAIADHIVLREVSSSSIDSGVAKLTLKISTGLVDTLDGKSIKSWDNFKIKIDGSRSMVIRNDSEPIASIKEWDPVEKIEDSVFQTIMPSVILEFKGDKVPIDTYSNRSSGILVNSIVDYQNMFDVSDKPSTKEEASHEMNK